MILKKKNTIKLSAFAILNFKADIHSLNNW